MPRLPSLPGLPAVRSTFVQGAPASMDAIAWWALEQAAVQGASVWWVDGGNDLATEHRALSWALEHERTVARLALASPNALPGHHLLDFQQQPWQDTWDWWRHHVQALHGRDPTPDETQSWAWRHAGCADPLPLSDDDDARTSPAVEQEAFLQRQDGLGHVLPAALLAQPHLLWVAHQGPPDRLNAWLGWLAQQHAEHPAAPPVWILLRHGNLSPVSTSGWWAGLEVGRRQAFYASHVSLLAPEGLDRPGLPDYLRRVDQAWEVRPNASRAAHLVTPLATGATARWGLPCTPLPAMKTRSWPTTPSWRAVVMHHALTTALSDHKGTPVLPRPRL